MDNSLKKEIDNRRIKTFSDIDLPSYLMNFPTTFDTRVQNNAWMEEMNEEEIKVDIDGALAQWFDLYGYLSTNGYCQVLPTPANTYYQDLVFVANLGVVLSHGRYTNTVIMSNFTSKPRIGENIVGENFFKISGYDVIQCPYKFEGEADLKHIRDNIYIGGYGQRTGKDAYSWMEEKFEMEIIKIKSLKPRLYHFDCVMFPMTKEDVLLTTKAIDKEAIKLIESVANVIHVPIKYAEFGVTNSVRLHNLILCQSDLNDLDPILDKDIYYVERDKNNFLEDISIDFGMEPAFVNLSEFTKGGASLSCLIMHLNRESYKVDLL